MKKRDIMVGTLAFGVVFAGMAAPSQTEAMQEKRLARRSLVKAERLGLAPAGVEVKKKAESEDKWEYLGKGAYTDLAFGVFGVPSPTVEVEFEKSTTTENRYRIVDPYKNVTVNSSDFSFSYDAESATPIVFDVIDDKYVFVHEFNTGWFVEGAGDIGVVMNAQYILDAGYGMDVVVDEVPDALCEYREGRITANKYFANGAQQAATFLVTLSADSNLYLGNGNGDFCIMMPGAKEPDPNEGWRDYGVASFTDVFIPALFKDVEETTFDVPIQQNEENPGVFRLVNPYMCWENQFEEDFVVKEKNYFVMHTEYAPFAWFESTDLGVEFTGEGAGKLSYVSQVGDLIDIYDVETCFAELPTEVWASFENNVFKYDNLTFQMNGEEYATFGVGISSRPDLFWRVKTDSFRVEFPDRSGVEGVEAVSDSPVECFTLQGVRVSNPEKGMLVIMRHGGKVTKTLIR